MKLEWDEDKRQTNIVRHGLDFADAGWVLESPYRLDIEVMRGGEARILSLAYVFGFLAVLLLVHTERDGKTRVISFRPASREESEVYHEWLENDCSNP